LIRCLFGFSAGVLAWKVHLTGRLRSGTALELASVALIFAFVWAAGTTALSIAAPAVLAPAVHVFAVQAGAVSRVLRRPLFLALGARSYSIYLVHLRRDAQLLKCTSEARRTRVRNHRAFPREQGLIASRHRVRLRCRAGPQPFLQASECV
jgi:peptidoglycan/LPS O-acetylase OafA/YrhL